MGQLPCVIREDEDGAAPEGNGGSGARVDGTDSADIAAGSMAQSVTLNGGCSSSSSDDEGSVGSAWGLADHAEARLLYDARRYYYGNRRQSPRRSRRLLSGS